MEKRKCSSCLEEHELDNFYFKNKKKKIYNSMCKGCLYLYQAKRWNVRKIESIKYKGGECEDCKLTMEDIHPCCFDFHHDDPSLKEFEWNKTRQLSKEKLKKELDKCTLLCSNCHRRRHIREDLW